MSESTEEFFALIGIIAVLAAIYWWVAGSLADKRIKQEREAEKRRQEELLSELEADREWEREQEERAEAERELFADADNERLGWPPARESAQVNKEHLRIALTRPDLTDEQIEQFGRQYAAEGRHRLLVVWTVRTLAS